MCIYFTEIALWQTWVFAMLMLGINIMFVVGFKGIIKNKDIEEYGIIVGRNKKTAIEKGYYSIADLNIYWKLYKKIILLGPNYFGWISYVLFLITLCLFITASVITILCGQ